VVIGGAPGSPLADAGPAIEALQRLVEAGAKPRPAAAVVSELTGVSANALYRGLTKRHAQ
jgi:16S rRNA (cytidine1402-2'-O)-methyltransferase